MPFIPVPNGVKTELRCTLAGERCENVFWFLASSPNPTLDDLQFCAGIVKAWWDAEIKTIAGNNTVLREVYATDQSVIDGEAYTLTTGLPLTGANVNEPLPNNVTLCISLRTAKRGRSYRGRSYIMGLTENQVLLNNVTEVAAAAWVAAYDVLISTAASEGYQLCVCSYRNAGAVRSAGVLTPVTDATIVDTTVDSMRRRLPGRGQ